MADTGRPPHFNTPEELEKKIQEYIESISSRVSEDEEGEPVYLGEPMTITGLAYFLGFESRQSFYDYEKRSDFSYIIKRARLRVESEYEKKLSQKNPTGSIFALKNMGWADKQEIKHEGIPDPIISVRIEKPTDE